MIETCKNYCVLKAFDIDSDMVSKCKKIADSEGVSLEFKQRNLDCKITLVNKSTSDIVFQRILDEILEVLDGNVYANYDTTLEQCVIENAIIVTCLSSAQRAAMIGKYLLPLWGFIMVFAALGLMISVFARSSKVAMIWSLASGLVLMPRFFVLIPEGIGKVLNLSTQTVEKISMISPGIMMEALSNPNNTSSWTTAVVGFTIGIVVLFGIAYIAFKNQDEYNYGE